MNYKELSKLFRTLDKRYLKAALRKKPKVDSHFQMPHLQSTSYVQIADQHHLGRYLKLFPNFNKENLPVTFPHIMAFPRHMELMLDRRFPFPLAGLVHIRNEIESIRPIPVHSRISMTVTIDEYTKTQKGLEFDIKTDIFHNRDCVWKSRSTILYRMASGEKPQKKDKKPFPDYQNRETFKVPVDIGLKYADVSGDFNPIHLYPMTAKLFGYNRNIAHGMWSLTKSLELLDSKLQGPNTKISCDFKLPIFVPSTIQFTSSEEDGRVLFGVLSKDGNRPHVIGEIQN